MLNNSSMLVWDVNDGKPLFRGEKQSGPGDIGVKALKMKY